MCNLEKKSTKKKKQFTEYKILRNMISSLITKNKRILFNEAIK